MNVVLNGRSALISGGSKGLGKAIALQLAQSGANVAILARDAANLDNAVKEIAGESGRDIRGYQCDVSDATQLEQACGAIKQDFGTVDILINNAGSSARDSFMGLTRDSLFADINLKLAPAIQLAQFVIPGMQQQSWGRIVNVVNIGAKAPQACSAPTSMTRAAGVAMTKLMANELATHNILVNALCVGRIRSDQWVRRHARDCPDMPYEDYLNGLATGIPLGRLGHASEFAQTVCFLVSDMASYITGTAINVDGGMSPVT